jgi:hypothetical protein
MASNAGISVAQKIEAVYVTMTADEQAVLSQLVRSALLHAADPRMEFVDEAVSGSASPTFGLGFTIKTAPELVQSIAGTRGERTVKLYSNWGC